MRDYTRRDAVKMFGATAGTAGLTGCMGDSQPSSNQTEGGKLNGSSGESDSSDPSNNSSREIGEVHNYKDISTNGPDGRQLDPLPILITKFHLDYSDTESDFSQTNTENYKATVYFEGEDISPKQKGNLPTAVMKDAILYDGVVEDFNSLGFDTFVEELNEDQILGSDSFGGWFGTTQSDVFERDYSSENNKTLIISVKTTNTDNYQNGEYIVVAEESHIPTFTQVGHSERTPNKRSQLLQVHNNYGKIGKVQDGLVEDGEFIDGEDRGGRADFELDEELLKKINN